MMSDFVYGAGWHRGEMARSEIWTPEFAQARYRGEHFDGTNPGTGRVVTEFGEERLALLTYSYMFNNFSVSFMDTHDRAALSYRFACPVGKYAVFRDWSDAQVAARSDQMLLINISTKRWGSDRKLSLTTGVRIDPSGSAARTDHPYSRGKKGPCVQVEHDPWPGLDVESCWVPFPKFGEWEPLFEPFRPQLEVFDIDIPPLKIQEQNS